MDHDSDQLDTLTLGGTYHDEETRYLSTRIIQHDRPRWLFRNRNIHRELIRSLLALAHAVSL